MRIVVQAEVMGKFVGCSFCRVGRSLVEVYAEGAAVRLAVVYVCDAAGVKITVRRKSDDEFIAAPAEIALKV